MFYIDTFIIIIYFYYLIITVMKFDLDKYLPLSNKKKIDILLNDITDKSILYHHKKDISKNIKNIIVKVYFDKKCQEKMKSKDPIIIDSKVYKTNPKKVIKKERQVNYDFVYSLKGITIKELAQRLNKTENTILSVFSQLIKNKKVHIKMILDMDDLEKCASFISNLKRINDRLENQEKEFAKELINSPSKRFIFKDNNQKSYGKAGNYGKLIYIKTKT